MKYEHAFAFVLCILSNFTSFEHIPYHSAFDNETVIISDQTKRSDPLEVDFYRIGDRVEGTGTFGVMHPLQVRFTLLLLFIVVYGIYYERLLVNVHVSCYFFVICIEHCAGIFYSIYISHTSIPSLFILTGAQRKRYVSL